MIPPWIRHNGRPAAAALLLGAYVIWGTVLFTGKPPPVVAEAVAAVEAPKAPAEVRVASIQFAARFGEPEDIHFVLEDYAGLKPWTLIFSSAWVWEEHPADWFWHEMPARAAKHDLHVIGANWSAAKPQKWRGYGFSEVIRNDGKVLSCAHGLLGSEIVYADLPVAVTPE